MKATGEEGQPGRVADVWEGGWTYEDTKAGAERSGRDVMRPNKRKRNWLGTELSREGQVPTG